jgi:two-component system, OmpR family, copper resistance phosphate regulon response regulator CusR
MPCQDMNQILVAEDEDRIAAFIEKGLGQKGFITTIVSDGEQAIAIAQSQQVDLLLLDLGLPMLDGMAVLKQLRAQGATFPIIVVTARSDESDRRAVLAAGATDFITKPFRFNDLLERVQYYLQ